jgi:hypothetical protein
MPQIIIIKLRPWYVCVCVCVCVCVPRAFIGHTSWHRLWLNGSSKSGALLAFQAAAAMELVIAFVMSWMLGVACGIGLCACCCSRRRVEDKDLRTQESTIPDTTIDDTESTIPSTTIDDTESTTIPSTTIVTYGKGGAFHWEGTCRYFRKAAKHNTYTPCALCAGVKKGV